MNGSRWERLKIINNIHCNTKIPDQCRKGTITRIYKGKGQRGMCSKQRGITVSSNLGKTYECVIDMSLQEQVDISNAQGEEDLAEPPLTTLSSSNKQ